MHLIQFHEISSKIFFGARPNSIFFNSFRHLRQFTSPAKTIPTIPDTVPPLRNREIVHLPSHILEIE